MSRGGALLAALLLAGCAGSGAPEDVGSAQTGASLACPDPCVLPVGEPARRPWEPHVAVDPRDPDHVVVGNAVFEAVGGAVATSWLVSHVTFDGGKTWRTTRLPGGPAAGPSHPLAFANAMGDAHVTFLSDGTVLYAGLAFDHAGTGASAAYASARTGYAFFVARSPDGGETWPEVSVVRQGSGALALALLAPPLPSGGMAALWDGNDKQWLAQGPDGTLLAAWARILILHPGEEPAGSRQDVVASVSKDGGRTWSEPVLVEKGGQWLGAAPVVTREGTMHVAYVDLFSFELRVATSRDGGATWTSIAVDRAAFFPALAAQPSGDADRLLLAYPQVMEDAEHLIAQDGHPQRVVVRHSDDGGATWSGPLVVDEPVAPGRTVPRLALSAEGTPLLTWFHATSEEAAEHRAVALRPEGPSHPLVLDAPQAPAARLGDYVGLDGAPGGAWSAWVTRSEDGYSVVAARLRLA